MDKSCKNIKVTTVWSPIFPGRTQFHVRFIVWAGNNLSPRGAYIRMVGQGDHTGLNRVHMYETGGSCGTQPWPRGPIYGWETSDDMWALQSKLSRRPFDPRTILTCLTLDGCPPKLSFEFPWNCLRREQWPRWWQGHLGFPRMFGGRKYKDLWCGGNSRSPVLSDGNLQPSSHCRAKHGEEKTC